MHSFLSVTRFGSAWVENVGPGVCHVSINYINSRARRPVVSVVCRRFTLGQRQFRTKGDCREHVRGILHRYQVDEVIPIDSPDHQDLRHLLSLHPAGATKAGPGVEFFTVGLRSGSQCFLVVRTDGSADDYSYVKCLDGGGGGGGRGGGGKAVGAATAAFAVSKALRCAVADQVTAFKRAAFEGADALGRVRCPLRGTLVAWADAHVDHEQPHSFSLLQRRWMDGEGLRRAEDVALHAAHSPPRLPEPLLGRWREFHRRHARLRILSAEANLSKGAKASHAGGEGTTEEEDSGGPEAGGTGLEGPCLQTAYVQLGLVSSEVTGGNRGEWGRRAGDKRAGEAKGGGGNGGDRV